MAQLDTVDLSTMGHRIEIYGPPKSGKTLLAGQLAQKYKLTWFDLENGASTLKQLPIEWQKNINLIRIPDNRANHLAIVSMLFLTEGKPVQICDYHGGVGGICIECDNFVRANPGANKPGTIQTIDLSSMNNATDIIVCDSLTQLSHSAMGYAFKGKQFIGQIHDAIIKKQEFSHYNIQGFLLDRFLTAVQQSGKNWVMISHEESLTMEDGNEKIVPMAGTRNFSKNSARYYDHVIRTSVFNGRFDVNSYALNNNNVVVGSRSSVNLSESGKTILDLYTAAPKELTSLPGGTPLIPQQK